MVSPSYPSGYMMFTVISASSDTRIPLVSVIAMISIMILSSSYVLTCVCISSCPCEDVLRPRDASVVRQCRDSEF